MIMYRLGVSFDNNPDVFEKCNRQAVMADCFVDTTDLQDGIDVVVEALADQGARITLIEDAFEVNGDADNERHQKGIEMAQKRGLAVLVWDQVKARTVKAREMH